MSGAFMGSCQLSLPSNDSLRGGDRGQTRTAGLEEPAVETGPTQQGGLAMLGDCTRGSDDVNCSRVCEKQAL